jgi:dTDP-4-amino-4,6-dideoxygalactose transaminase
VNSGTSALHLGLLALGIGPGDEVIVPSFTFAASANAVAITGATPVFVDIEPDYFSIDPLAVKAAIGPSTKAVIAVHLYGHPANLSELKDICDSAGIHLVEDAAQAHLAEFAKTPVGAWGAVAAFSFYPTKNMTTGEGGMSVTGDQEVARRIRLLRNHLIKHLKVAGYLFHRGLSILNLPLGRRIHLFVDFYPILAKFSVVLSYSHEWFQKFLLVLWLKLHSVWVQIQKAYHRLTLKYDVVLHRI